MAGVLRVRFLCPVIALAQEEKLFSTDKTLRGYTDRILYRRILGVIFVGWANMNRLSLGLHTSTLLQARCHRRCGAKASKIPGSSPGSSMIDAEGLSFTYGSAPNKGSCHEDSDRHRSSCQRDAVVESSSRFDPWRQHV